jgi:hypothetical protein
MAIELSRYEKNPSLAWHEMLGIGIGAVLFGAGIYRAMMTAAMFNTEGIPAFILALIIQSVGLLRAIVRPHHPQYELSERLLGWLPYRDVSITVLAWSLFWGQFIVTKLWLLSLGEPWLINLASLRLPITQDTFDVLIAFRSISDPMIFVFGTYFVPGMLLIRPPTWWLLRNLKNAFETRLLKVVSETVEDNLEASKQLNRRAVTLMLEGRTEEAWQLFDAAGELAALATGTYAQLKTGEPPALPDYQEQIRDVN